MSRPQPVLFAWNPRQRLFQGRLGSALPVPSFARLNNFGDLLGPIVARHILRENGLTAGRATADSPKLLTVGSVLHFANDGDTVWGTGINGKIDLDRLRFTSLDVRAVRGPLTRDRLEAKGISVPEVYGDPGLLIPRVYPELIELGRTTKHEITVIPNFNDYVKHADDPHVVNPRAPLMRILERIATSAFVTGSSLHAIIIAESLGIPARLIAPQTEDLFKYRDYYLGSGRDSFFPARDVREALELGGEAPVDANRDALVGSFPLDIFE